MAGTSHDSLLRRPTVIAREAVSSGEGGTAWFSASSDAAGSIWVRSLGVRHDEYVAKMQFDGSTLWRLKVLLSSEA